MAAFDESVKRGWPEALVLRLLLGGIWLYRHSLSALIGRQCRFAPTCSEYASIALGKYGVKRGLQLAIRRLLRCHPWGSSGFDPVP
ncbi:MAG: membrane protein insertion efficiency factor YidD [Pseudomonadota bacterium]